MREPSRSAVLSREEPSRDIGRPRELLGHPIGLIVLFSTDMWGYFANYGLRTTLIYYLTQTLSFRPAQASLAFGTYSAAVYLAPLVGGYVADRYLGVRRGVYSGAVMIALGDALVAFPALMYIGLMLTVLGSGLFSCCLPSQIAGLYAKGDARCAFAYNLYYVGCNIGAFLGAMISGALGERYGWPVGFIVSGLMATPALIIYRAGQRFLPTAATVTSRTEIGPSPLRAFDPQALRVLIGVVVAVVIFRVGFDQISNALVLWVAQGVDRHAGAFEIPLTWFQSIDPVVVILIGPLVGMLWTRRANRGHAESPCGRMALGATIVGLSYVALAITVRVLGQALANWMIVVVFMTAMTIGELFILPAALSVFGRLAPRGASAFTLAIFYVATAAGDFLGGVFAMLWARLGPPSFFLLAGGFAFVAAVLLRKSSAAAARLVARNGSNSPFEKL